MGIFTYLKSEYAVYIFRGISPIVNPCGLIANLQFHFICFNLYFANDFYLYRSVTNFQLHRMILIIPAVRISSPTAVKACLSNF
jgi:hypothetical protein